MTMRNMVGLVGIAALLASCGGGGGGDSGSAPVAATPTPTPAPTPAPTAAAGCTLRERQDWVAAQMNEWYLFPELLPASLNPAGYNNLDDYLDALTATARAQRKDRFFTYVTSIAAENAYYTSGATAGFGFRLTYDGSARRLFVSESFEGAPALAAGIDRGAEIVAVGTSAATQRTIADLAANGGNALSDAFGPDTAGTTRVLRIRDASGATRDVSVAKADFALQPVSPRYGAKIIDDGGRRIGYVNLRTFINTADPQLRAAFQSFRDAGITQVIVDLRYNGGGLLSTAQLMTDLLAANRTAADVQSFVTFRPSKSSENETLAFAAQPQAIAATRIAFIGTGASASASEYVINAMIPYLRAGAGLIGTNTYGKPVGQIAIDRAQCDDRLRVIAFALQNADRQGDYYDGLATKVGASCQAADDLTRQPGDPAEASTRAALEYLAGRSCTRIAGASARTLSAAPRELLQSTAPSIAQRKAPGSF